MGDRITPPFRGFELPSDSAFRLGMRAVGGVAARMNAEKPLLSRRKGGSRKSGQRVLRKRGALKERIHRRLVRAKSSPPLAFRVIATYVRRAPYVPSVAMRRFAAANLLALLLVLLADAARGQRRGSDAVRENLASSHILFYRFRLDDESLPHRQPPSAAAKTWRT